MRNMKTLDPKHLKNLDPFYTELLTAERFLEMYKNDRDNIVSARAIPEPLGSKALGYILVRRKRPLYPPLAPNSFK